MADLTRLKNYLARIPGTKGFVERNPVGAPWSLAFTIDLDSAIAWNVVQEIAYVCNGLSLTSTLPVTFLPDSPAPNTSGGPRACLFWRISAVTDNASPDLVAEFLEGRLPRPVDDLSKWGNLDTAVRSP